MTDRSVRNFVIRLLSSRKPAGQFVREHGGFVDIGSRCFGVADGTVLNWRGVNYVPMKTSLRVRLHNRLVGGDD